MGVVAGRRRTAGSVPGRLLTLLLVAVSVGLDNFAAAIGIGIAGVDRRLRLRIAVVFGLFEAGMPVIGLLIGRGLAGTLGDTAHIVGGVLLIAAGAQMGISTLRGDEDEGEVTAARVGGASLGRLVLLAAGLSIDNLVIGFALGAQSVSLVVAVIVIGVVSVGLSLVGLELGARLGERVGQRSELIGATVLVLVGIALATSLL